ncbi:MAG: hypothetical protein ABI041_05850 [Bdellovibrionia bacterium]
MLTSSFSFAAMNGVSVAATYPTPQGFAYQTLEHGFGLQAEAWMDSPHFLSHMFPQMHFALNYEPFSVRGLSPANLSAMGITSGLGVTMIGAFVGLQAQSGDYGNSFTPFFTIDVGAVFDTMTYVNTASVNSNSGAAFAAQLVPGFDLPIAGHFGIIVELPVKIYNLKNTFTIWDAVAGLRLKL